MTRNTLATALLLIPLATACDLLPGDDGTSNNDPLGQVGTSSGPSNPTLATTTPVDVVLPYLFNGVNLQPIVLIEAALPSTTDCTDTWLGIRTLDGGLAELQVCHTDGCTAADLGRLALFDRTFLELTHTEVTVVTGDLLGGEAPVRLNDPGLATYLCHDGSREPCDCIPWGY